MTTAADIAVLPLAIFTLLCVLLPLISNLAGRTGRIAKSTAKPDPFRGILVHHEGPLWSVQPNRTAS